MTRRPFLILIGGLIGAAQAPAALARKLRERRHLHIRFTSDVKTVYFANFEIPAILHGGPADQHEMRLTSRDPEGSPSIRIPVAPLAPFFRLDPGADPFVGLSAPRFTTALYRHRGRRDRRGRFVYLYQEPQ